MHAAHDQNAEIVKLITGQARAILRAAVDGTVLHLAGPPSDHVQEHHAGSAVQE
jgi:hypothetical protein